MLFVSDLCSPESNYQSIQHAQTGNCKTIHQSKPVGHSTEEDRYNCTSYYGSDHQTGDFVAFIP